MVTFRANFAPLASGCAESLQRSVAPPLSPRKHDVGLRGVERRGLRLEQTSLHSLPAVPKARNAPLLLLFRITNTALVCDAREDVGGYSGYHSLHYSTSHRRSVLQSGYVFAFHRFFRRVGEIHKKGADFRRRLSAAAALQGTVGMIKYSKAAGRGPCRREKSV